MSIVLEAWNQLTVLSPSGSGAGGGQHHLILADSQLFPNPDPEPLPDKAQNGVNKFIGMIKTALYAVAVVAGLFVCIGMTAGMRGRSNFAKDAITHMPWVFGGVIGGGALVGILDMFA